MDIEFLENISDTLRQALDEENWDRVVQVINELDSKMNDEGFDEFYDEEY